MQVESYLFFNGRCEEAVEFYRRALGAEVTMLMRYKDSPEPPPPDMVPPGSDEKVMHASFRIGDTTVMASDGCTFEAPVFQGFSLAITAPDADAVDRLFNALTLWPKAARCRCRPPRPSGHRATAWSPTASACRGW